MTQAQPDPPSPSVSWQALFPKRRGQSGQQPPGLLHEQSVSNYLKAFIDPGNPLSPTHPDQVVSDLKGIWQEHGFLPVDELTMTLLRRYRPTASPVAAAALQQRLKSRYDSPESLTGFQRKQYAPLVTGLAHLYAVTTGQAVTLVECDMSNMGFTNEHFRNLMALRDGVEPDKVPVEKVHQLTDQAARVVTNLARKTLNRAAAEVGQPGSQILAFRTGGDEIRFLCLGLRPDQVEQRLQKQAIPSIERFTAAAGLHDHAHGKHPNNRWRNGFGIALTSFGLDAQTRPGLEMHAAEQRLERQKQTLGTARRGRLERTVLPLRETPDRSEPGTLSTPELLKLAHQTGYLKNSYSRVNPQARAEIREVLQAHGVIDPAQPRLNGPDLLGLLQQELAHELGTQAAQRHQRYQQLKAVAGTLYPPQHLPLDYAIGSNQNPYALEPATAGLVLQNFEALLGRQRYGHFLSTAPYASEALSDSSALFKKPFEREVLALRQDWTRTGTRVDATTQRLFEHVLGIFNPIDPSTSTLMGDMMPEVFGQFARDTRHLEQQTGSNGLTAFGFRASMNNLAGINKKLGSQNANLLLHHFAQHVVLGSFAAAGFDPEQLIAGHLGGGHLVVAVPPMVASATRTTEAHLQRVADEIKRRVDELQRQPVGDFVRQRGGVLPDGLDANLTFADIPDPKRAGCEGIETMTNWLVLRERDGNGLPVNGGANLGRLNQQAERLIDARRTERQKLQFSRMAPG
jgi:GGDEF domain-containing protein